MEYSRKRKRDNCSYIIFERKRKIEDDNIYINKFQKIEYFDIDINNKKRVGDILDNELNNNKKNKTYNCFIHDNIKEVCNIYQCSGVMCMNINKNVMQEYIK